MRSAGEGLAAAHAADLLHRDFKPGNVMLGDDGRVRVMDFGLARVRASTVTPETEESQPGPIREGLAVPITRADTILGTPGYMSPEQCEGEEVTEAADQFAFCVSLWEALYGERPFEGRSFLPYYTHVVAGNRRPPPKGRTVPSWLRRVCERGLSVEPAQRWPPIRPFS
jgi:serine/threonine protein kinase